MKIDQRIKLKVYNAIVPINNIGLFPRKISKLISTKNERKQLCWYEHIVRM